MKTSLAVRLEELIRGTDDKKFLQIYNDLLDFKKIHFIEFKIINRISLLNDLVNIIEDEKEARTGIEEITSTKARTKINKLTKPLTTKDQRNDSVKENEKTEDYKNISFKGSDFKSILLYVIIVHIFGFVFMWGYNQYLENMESRAKGELQTSTFMSPSYSLAKKDSQK
jgi:hypothetical protein